MRSSRPFYNNITCTKTDWTLHHTRFTQTDMHIPHRASMDATDHSYPAPQRPALPAAPTSIRLFNRDTVETLDLEDCLLLTI